MPLVEQVVLRSTDIEAVVLPAHGARLHSLRVRGHDLLRTPDDVTDHERDPFFWGGYVMAPWCNRLTPERLEVAGRMVELRPNFEDGSAIHGQVYGAAWSRTGEATFAIEAGGRDGWPWRYRVSAGYVAEGRAIAIALRVTNLDDAAMPAGVGLHPWFRGRPLVRINSATAYASNKDRDARSVPVSGSLDLRQPAQMAEGVDATWAEPAEPPVELWWPEHGLHATITARSPTLHVVAAYAPERGAIAVEPQTHAPEGLRRLLANEPGALRLIDPGELLDLPITVAFDDA